MGSEANGALDKDFIWNYKDLRAKLRDLSAESAESPRALAASQPSPWALLQRAFSV
jgi:hypothetical protein